MMMFFLNNFVCKWLLKLAFRSLRLSDVIFVEFECVGDKQFYFFIECLCFFIVYISSICFFCAKFFSLGENTCLSLQPAMKNTTSGLKETVTKQENFGPTR